MSRFTYPAYGRGLFSVSIAATKWVLDLRDVKPMQKLVLFILADHANKFGGSCFPGINTIEAETGLSRRAVINNIQLLEAAGRLLVERRPGEGDGRKSNSYTLPLGQCAASAPGGQSAPKAGQSAPQVGQSAGYAPEPSVEPPEEPPVRGANRPSRRCPQDWQPRGKDIAALLAETPTLTADHVEKAVRKIRDHEFRAAKKDWDAVFRNWIRSDRDRGNIGHVNAITGRRKSRADEARERLSGSATGGGGARQARLVNPD